MNPSARIDFDIAVIGAGFAGSLLGMAARRSGRSVVLLERGRHPRFVIGESSTPLANLLLERFARRYDLPGVSPLCKWGSWQRQCPQVGCGLKRGFTFYHHGWDRPWREDRQLLVAASPHDAVADTHWYRADFDAYLIQQAQALGVAYLDQVRLHRIDLGDPITLHGEHGSAPLSLGARLVVDASGPRGGLYKLLPIASAPLPHLPATQTVYSHFRGVRRWHDLFPTSAPPPYPPDDAALHHVFPGGWIWVLRFNNGLTSAGVMATPGVLEELDGSDPGTLWQRLLDRLPSVREQFREAEPCLPFMAQPEVAFRAAQMAGPGWVLLPSAAGFVDPLLSTGFPLTLLGLERLAGLVAERWDDPALPAALAGYAQQTERELLRVESLIAALYRAMDDPDLFNPLTLLYFAAASYTETVRRLGRPELAGPSFLCADHAIFGPRLDRILREVLAAPPSDKVSTAKFIAEILRAIEPIDVAGLSDRARHPWYPVRAEDLLTAADKVQASRTEIERMLEAVGFYL